MQNATRVRNSFDQNLTLPYYLNFLENKFVPDLTQHFPCSQIVNKSECGFKSMANTSLPAGWLGNNIKEIKIKY